MSHHIVLRVKDVISIVEMSIDKSKLANEDDETLLLYISDQGNAEELADHAFKIFYSRYKNALTVICESICKNIVGTKGVEDLLTEVFMKVYYKADSFEVGDAQGRQQVEKRIEAWLFSIAQNLFRDWIRKSKKVPQIPVSSEKELSYLNQGNNSKAEIVNLSKESEIFKEVWDSLKERERDILRISYLYYDTTDKQNQLPSEVVNELADFHQTSKANVRKIRQRSLAKLKKRCMKRINKVNQKV